MDAAAKNQIIERVKQANNILVTVSTNPSVDQLAACLGITLLLNRMGKHATAVFSGQVPSTLEFLQPEKTIETSTDSLRDFIISLDKEKADKLRYKVEDEVVRIFITPYKASLSEADLVFSQGDYNVEAVLALGIKDRTQIDAAITAHGRILYDATVISLNAGSGKAPQLGQINWQDPSASSLCEMLVSVSEAFGPGLIDNQMATSFLTGIVAETNRFSNNKTSPKVMTMAAQLMAAGANQQLIVSKLEPPPPPAPKYDPNAVAAKKPAPPPLPAGKPQAEIAKGTLTVDHGGKGDGSEVKINSEEIHIDAQGNLITAADLELQASQDKEIQLPSPPPALKPAEPPLAPLPGPHSVLNPSNHKPTLDSPFTANTQPEWENKDENNAPIDPLSGGMPSTGILSRGPSVQPLGITPTVDVEDARSAVTNAIAAAPFDPGSAGPVQALNAQVVDLSEPPAEEKPLPDNATPSLTLPGNNFGNVSVSPPASPPAPAAQAAPPPIPPPLTLPATPPIPSSSATAK